MMAYFNHLIMIEDLILSPSLPGWNCVWSLKTRGPRKAEMLCPGSACFAIWGTPSQLHQLEKAKGHHSS